MMNEKNIGIKAVQEVISAKKHYLAEYMFVASNRYFSKEAIILATEHEVHLIDRDVLMKLVCHFKPKIDLGEKRIIATTEESKEQMKSKYPNWI